MASLAEQKEHTLGLVGKVTELAGGLGDMEVCSTTRTMNPALYSILCFTNIQVGDRRQPGFRGPSVRLEAKLRLDKTLRPHRSFSKHFNN